MIRSEQTHRLATYWAVTCICIHNLALRHEARTRSDGDISLWEEFIWDGLALEDFGGFDASGCGGGVGSTSSNGQATLMEGKRFHEGLKCSLLDHRSNY